MLRLSVVMPVYNGSRYLKEAVNSILSQTYSDFEFIVINDGSTDNTLEILSSYKDDRLIVINNNKNKGLVASLNLGIKSAKSTWIARQDADDYSDPSRLEKQVDFLKKHTDVIIVGSSMAVMNQESQITHKHSVLINDPELRQELLLRSPFAHGSVVFNKESVIKAGLYRQEYWPAEDYDLWLRLSKYGRLANIDEYLYVYREIEGTISTSNKVAQTKQVSRIQALAWQEKNRLVVNSRIRLSVYRKKDSGQQRIDRILENISFASSKARSDQKTKRFIVRNSALVASSPLTYKKFTGNIKRRLRHV